MISEISLKSAEGFLGQRKGGSERQARKIACLLPRKMYSDVYL
jgi:hypothetical protein